MPPGDLSWPFNPSSTVVRNLLILKKKNVPLQALFLSILNKINDLDARTVELGF
jgi:hypothetical protein